MRIVGTIDDFAGDLIYESVKHLLDGSQVRIVIEMFLLDVKNDCVLRMINAQGAVTLVSFRHEIVSVRLPVRIGTEDRDLGAHIMRRIQPPNSQNVCSHRGGGGLAMHPGDHDPFFDLHHRGQCFRTPHHRKSQFDRFIEGGISALIAEE